VTQGGAAAVSWFGRTQRREVTPGKERIMARIRPGLLAISILLAGGLAAGDPYDNVQVNERLNGPEETSIAIDPSNPDNVLGVAQVPCHFYVSSDAGLTWDEGDLPDPFDLGDPAVVFDRAGNAYYAYIGTFSHSGIFVNRSTDGGRTWKAAGTAVIEHNGAVPFEDKSYPVCDWTAGPTQNNLYIAWTQFTEYGSPSPADSSWILFSRSTDHAATFSPPVRVSDRGGDAIDEDDTVEGAVPAVGPDGTIYLAWSGPRGIEFDRSTDGGVSFGRDRVITDQPGGWDFDVPGISRANGLPVTKVDQSSGGHRGRVYVNWSDQRSGDTDVFLIHSDDQGETFSAPVRVNDDAAGNGAHQFFCWMDVDAVTGFVYVLFYDRRAHAPPSTETDVYLAISEDGGESFTNVRVSESAFTPDPSVFFGDYAGISAFAGRVRPLWTRMDGTVRTVWTALIDFQSASACHVIERASQLTAAPNPMRSSGIVLCYAGGRTPSHVEIHNVEGRLVRSLAAAGPPAGGTIVEWDGRDAAGGPVAPGIYFASAPGLSPAKITKLR
jgi:hypothetical protein